jgi:16S rRNA (guanine966-N2)-methyltransferase
VRIIAGKFRGRRLAAPRGRDVRPTGDRVREALFSILGDLDGCSALDLFAGTGAMGLEAISRGSVHAVFVEVDRQACEVVRRNVDATVTDDVASVRIEHTDAVRALSRLAADGEHYDIIFFDPPYERTEVLIAEVALALPSVCHDRTRIVFEVATRHADLVEKACGAWGCEALTTRRYGDTSVAILRPTPAA